VGLYTMYYYNENVQSILVTKIFLILNISGLPPPTYFIERYNFSTFECRPVPGFAEK